LKSVNASAISSALPPMRSPVRSAIGQAGSIIPG
jgi:hypothetical protein